MNKNVKLSFVTVILLLAGVAFYFTPHLALYNMKKAAENRDADTLSDYVDYVSLRESLKANFNAKMAAEVAKDAADNNPFSALGKAFATALINPMIDALVTPESLSMLMQGEKPDLKKIGSSPNTKSPPKESKAETSMCYKSFNRFVVKVKGKDSPEDPVEFIFKRDGLFAWKLSALRLPSFTEETTFSTAQSKSIQLGANSKKLEANETKQIFLMPTLINKRFQDADWQREIYEDAIWFDVSWDTSPLQKPTRAIKGVLVISDIFGEPKLRLKWTINEQLSPGRSYTEKGVGFKYNQFNDSHNWVRVTKLKDMTFQFEVTDVIYQDGTQETF